MKPMISVPSFRKTVLVLVGTLSSIATLPEGVGFAQEPPTGDEVIEDFIDALGSEMVLRSLSSFKLKCRYSDGDFVIHYHEGNLHWNAGEESGYWFDYKNKFWEFQKGEYSHRNDFSPGYPSGFISLPVDPLRWIDDETLKISNLGSKTLADRETWCLLFESDGQESAHRWFDKKTKLLLQTKTLETSRVYSYRYSELDEQLFATGITVGTYGGPVNLSIVQLEIDPAHEGIKFSIPNELKDAFSIRGEDSEQKPDK